MSYVVYHNIAKIPNTTNKKKKNNDYISLGLQFIKINIQLAIYFSR